MIPLNLSSLGSNPRLNQCDASSTADRSRCRPDALTVEGGGGRGGRGRRLKRVRFSDDEVGNKMIRSRENRKEHRRESSNRKRQRTEADENKEDNTMDTQRSNFDWNEVDVVAHIFRSTTTTIMTTMSGNADNDEDCLASFHQSTTDQERNQFPSIPIPHDPRLWSRLDVYNWLEHMKSLEGNLGDLDPARFLMNGKALCLMTPAMFVYRVPHGGRILYKDFQTRLSRAVAEVHHKNCISI